MPTNTILICMLLLPACSFILLALAGRTHLRQFAASIGTGLLFISAALAMYTAYGYFFEFGKQAGVYQKLIPIDINWLPFSDTLSIHMGILLDPISVMMLVVVTFISLMVHIYSIGYMIGDERVGIYYAFLGLFTFSMLGLVVATNIFQMYIFWELVGLSSFLLIGYYYNKPSAVAACKKAFIVTRFADLGFLIGILVLSYYSGSFDFSEMVQQFTATDGTTPAALQKAASASFMGLSALSWGLLLVFMGGAGKSAMFPLHIWLPDAMEGPTPVSALIHAATMVVAGVFLVARLFPVFALSGEAVLNIVAMVGAFSALFAAVVACTQTDIKRVLAYSTMSQIGFMMFSLGVSGYGGENGLGYTASMFHLFTHAMFKALLFLGAGAVIHYVHSNEMADMGGLRKYLPVTHTCFLIACLAIAGVPPFAGFFSKEEILLAAWQHNKPVYWLAIITSALTAFYMFRLYFSIFWNKNFHAHSTPHHGEGGVTMMLPLVVLALGAISAGFIPFGQYVSSDGAPLHTSLHFNFSILPVCMGILGILIAAWMYKNEKGRSDVVARSFGSVFRWARQKFYVDELYVFITRHIIINMIAKPAAWIDKHIVDGMINMIGNGTRNTAEKIKTMQSGQVQQYALYFLGAAIGIIILFIYIWK